MKRSQFAVMFAVTGLFLPVSSSQAFTMFVDEFDSVLSAANYTTVSTDLLSSFPTFGYDYSLMGIPPAPSTTDGSTFGLRMDANFSTPNQAEALTVLTLAQYSGNYTVKFDAWLNANGPFPGGGSGSTNYLTAGVGHNGTTNNFVANTGSGGWTAVNGENGSGSDYRLYKDGALQGVASGQYAAGTAANARNGLNGYYDQFGGIVVDDLPVQGVNNGGPAQQTGTSFNGSFGMDWHQVKLVVDADGGTGGTPSMTWFIDGLPIGTLDGGVDGAFSAIGRVALGYSDPTSNGSDNPPLSFALVDNLMIVPEPGSLLLLVLGCVSLLAGRRR